MFENGISNRGKHPSKFLPPMIFSRSHPTLLFKRIIFRKNLRWIDHNSKGCSPPLILIKLNLAFLLSVFVMMSEVNTIASWCRKLIHTFLLFDERIVGKPLDRSLTGSWRNHLIFLRKWPLSASRLFWPTALWILLLRKSLERTIHLLFLRSSPLLRCSQT